MAKKEAEPAASEAPATLEARVLTPAVLGGVACEPGAVIVGARAAVEGWAGIGLVDPHPDAVAYAREQGAPEIDVTPPGADENKE
jgi:hypothetical protein